MTNDKQQTTNNKKTIALFGTSADPPTTAHLEILRWLSSRYDLVAVWASDNPFKAHQTNLDRRTKMLELTIADLKTSRHNVAVCQQLSDRRSLVAVERAMSIWGENSDYSLVIGSDLIEQIRSWYRIKELLAKVRVLVVPRPGYSVEEKDIKALQELGGKCSIAPFDIPDVSSTNYRDRGDLNIVTPSVREYIDREHLYAQ
jgi:nicotinate-nucleotide adenylyltransferase